MSDVLPLVSKRQQAFFTVHDAAARLLLSGSANLQNAEGSLAIALRHLLLVLDPSKDPDPVKTRDCLVQFLFDTFLTGHQTQLDNLRHSGQLNSLALKKLLPSSIAEHFFFFEDDSKRAESDELPLLTIAKLQLLLAVPEHCNPDDSGS